MKFFSPLYWTWVAVLISSGTPAPAAASLEPASAAVRPSASGSGASFLPELSADGRKAVFLSVAQNLVNHDEGALWLDVFVRDLDSGSTVLASVNTTGIGGGNAEANAAVISSNGQYVAFTSAASNLVPDDTNDASDVFVRDLEAGTTTLVSVDVEGRSPANPFPPTHSGFSGRPVISADGRWIVFESWATNLASVPDGNRFPDLFARDVQAGNTILLSVNAAGTAAGNGQSEQAAIAPDGQRVAFVSTATDLVAGTTNRLGDVYVRDVAAGQTWWASSQAGATFPVAAGYRCFHPAISADGQTVVFKVSGTNAAEVRVIHHDLRSGTSTLVVSNSAPDSWPQLSRDGRFVAYEEFTNVWVWDRDTGSNDLASVALDGTHEASGPARTPVMTPDGRFVAFLSRATNLVDGVTNGRWQLYTRDRQTRTTTLTSTGADGRPGTASLETALPSVSDDGRRIGFESRDDDLVPGDLNRSEDVFLRDLALGTTSLISERHQARPSAVGVAPSGAEPKALSADGTRLLFTSLDSSLADGDTNGWQDVFLRDVVRGTTVPISVEADGRFTTNRPFARRATLSADGNHAAFVWGHYFDLYYSSFSVLNPGDIFWRDLETGVSQPVNLDLFGRLVPDCLTPMISPDGRAVAFSSDEYVDYLVPGGYGGNGSTYNVFIRDMIEGTNGLVSVDRFGDGLWDVGATNIAFSPDGRWLLFVSAASGITTNSVSGVVSLYARNLAEDYTLLVSVGTNGAVTHHYAEGAVFSGDSRHVAFATTTQLILVHDLVAHSAMVAATNARQPSLSHDGQLVAYQAPASGTEARNVYVADRRSGAVSLVSRGLSGGGGNANSTTPLISRDGRYVVFESKADDLVANDTNRASDIFVRDLWLGTTLLASLNHLGTGPGNGPSSTPMMAANGRTVVFQSFASDLVPGDYNDRRDVFVLRLGGADTDTDSLDDDWEMAYFESLARDGTGDFDQDGATDSAEFRAGTDPTNVASVFQVLSVTSPGTNATRLLWSAVPGRAYRVQFKNSVDDSEWTDLPGPVIAAGTTGVATDNSAPGQGQRYYRVLLEP